jgi:multisubunit Na+/H+ antiporter MnhC subunit
MDQLAIKVSCSSAEKNIEIFEIIPNEFNTYKKLEDGENKEISKHNVYFQLDKNVQKLKIILENLQNKKITYDVVNAATNDSNYLLTAINYPNSTTVELKDNKHTLEITNPYYNIDDNKKPYTLLLVSVLGEDKDLSYNAKIEKDGEQEENDDDYTVLIVFICLVSAIVIGFITLALFMIVIKKRNKKNNTIEDENEMNQKLDSNILRSEVDP